MSDEVTRDAMPIGSEVGGYIIRKVLGQGGFGITYAASSAAGMVDRRVAIKEFFPQGLAYRDDRTVTLSSRIDKAAYEAALRRFEAEARKLVDVYDHPNIVRGENVVHAYGSVFLIMEFLDGVMLHDWVMARGGLPEADVRALMEPVFDAVSYLHNAQAMHRDLSPRNIMIRTMRRGQAVVEPVVIDFGAIGDGLDLIHDSTITVANPLYSPPEQQEPQGVMQGRFTDVFALGGCVYFTATGKAPVKPMTRLAATAHGRPDPMPPAASLVADPKHYSRQFFDGLDRALRLDPTARPQTVDGLSGLLGWATLDPARRDAATIITPPPEMPARKRSHAGLWIGAALGTVAAAGAAVLVAPHVIDQFAAPPVPKVAGRDTPPPVPAPAKAIAVVISTPNAPSSPAASATNPSSTVPAPLKPAPEAVSKPAAEPEPKPSTPVQVASLPPESDTHPVAPVKTSTTPMPSAEPAPTPEITKPVVVIQPVEPSSKPAEPARPQPTTTEAGSAPGIEPAVKPQDRVQVAALPPAPVPPTQDPVKSAPVSPVTPAIVSSIPPSAEPPARSAEPLTVPQLALQYASLSPDSGVVSAPRTAADVYHNARFHEQRGEALAARQAYLELARFDIDAIDAWTRFATVLRVQDGRAGARDVFAELAPTPHSTAYDLIAATLYDDVERRRRIEAFVGEHPDYGPGWYLLADELSEARLGSQTLGEKHRESEALGRFLSADEEGELVRHFMDPIMLGNWIDSARRRKTTLDTMLEHAQSTPAAIFSRSNSDWSVTVQLPEAALGFAYRLGPTGIFTTAGATQSIDQRTGKPFPNTLISVVPGREPKEIDVRYTDLRGVDVGPFPIAFDPTAALVQQIKQTLGMTKGSWVAFGGSDTPLMYMTHLASYVCGIDKASFGLDGNPADRPLPLPACNPKDPYAIPSNFMPYMKIPAATKSATVRIVFKDGTSEQTVIPR